MVKRHLKRLIAPKGWPIKRKEHKWIIRPNPGPHALSKSVPLNLVIKNMLKYAKTTREVKLILNQRKVLINKVARTDQKFPVGIMDIVEIPEINEHYRMVYNKQGKFILIRIDDEEARFKPVKIINKKTLKGKKTQLNLNDGTNMIVDKDVYKVNDTIIMDLTKESKERIKKHLKFEKGAKVYLTDGKHIGKTGYIEEIQNLFQNQMVTFKSYKETYQTSKEYTLVIDDSISVGEK
ncbi:MAG: 30S ribosomal protein S4e [Candidatus Nanoarchaeia archaeon]